MGLFNSVKNIMGFGDDDEFAEDYEEFEEVNIDAINSRAGNQGKKNMGKVINMPRTTNNEVVVFVPHSFEDAPQVCEQLKGRKPVVINIEQMDRGEAQRTIDFLCGTICAIDGKIKKVSDTIFLAVPSEVDISGNVKEGRSTGRGYSFN